MEDSDVEIRPTVDKGRGLFSLRNFQKGDVIFEEVPIVSCQFAWNQDYGYKACDHCLRPLETAEENVRRLSMNEKLNLPYPEQCTVDKSTHVPCLLCNVIYCSKECQTLAFNLYHKTLCLQKLGDGGHPLEILKQMWKEMHYPPETATIMLFARIFAMIHQAEDKEAVSHLIQQFCRPLDSQENMSANLLNLRSSDQLEILRQQLLKSVPTEHVTQWITPDGFWSLVALVGMNGQGIGTSAVSDWVKNVEKMDVSEEEREELANFIEKLYEDFDHAVGDFLNNEGSGLYPMQSSINHSCSPNAEVAFPNSTHRLVVRCIRDILREEEVTISYVDECILQRSRHSRRKTLEAHYFFKCRCQKCEEETEQPDVTSEEEEESGEEGSDE